MEYIYWNTSSQIPGTPWSISGYSKCAKRTGFYVNGLNILLDAGPQCSKKLDHIFITHTHCDHIAELPLTVLHNQNISTIIYCPEHATQYIENYIQALFDANTMIKKIKNNQIFDTDTMDSNTTTELKSIQSMTPVDPKKLKLTIVPISNNRNTLRIIANNQKLEVETVGADHSIDTVVYGFSTIKNKLNPIYDGLNGQKIKEMKDSGINVTIEIIEKKFCFVLDTSSNILESHPFLLEYPVIIIECTFLYDDEVITATNKKHIHWLQLKPYVISHPKIQFILAHFSQKYKMNDIKQFFDNIKETENITNIIPWLHD